MDFFGIGAALEGCANIYFRGARQTGRTLAMVSAVKDGDRIVCSDPREAKRVERMCDERGKKVECIVISPNNPSDIFKRGTSQGRTIFDHSWVEAFFLDAIRNRQKDIDDLERMASGTGEAHHQTRMAALDIRKWKG